MSITIKQINAPSFSKTEASSALWKRGNLTWKLDDTQKKIYEAYKRETGKISVWLCSRRLGKSFTLLIIALEQCLKKPGSVVKYLAPEQKQVRTILRSLFQEVMADCPDNISPTFRRDDAIFKFPNGSEIQLAGCDNQQYESLRGGKADLCIVDEAGFIGEIEYIVKSVLLPTTLSTNGRIILSSTPPRSSSHEFTTTYVKDAIFDDSLIKFTIHDCPRYTPEQVEQMCEEYGGRDSTEWRREFLCELITDEDSAIIPEFNDETAKDLVKEWPRPTHFDSYVGMDVGFKDLTVALFGYYDFKAAKLIIEDEIVIKNMTTDELALKIKEKEAALWTQPMTGEVKTPFLRVSDNNLILINDLKMKHGLLFIPSDKDNAEAALNNVRVMIKSGQIIIHPRCRSLILHLKNGVWNKSRKSFDRSPDHGHYDAIDALKYLCRHIQLSKNPYPYGYTFGGEGSWHYTQNAYDKAEHALLKIFKRKR